MVMPKRPHEVLRIKMMLLRAEHTGHREILVLLRYIQRLVRLTAEQALALQREIDLRTYELRRTTTYIDRLETAIHPLDTWRPLTREELATANDKLMENLAKCLNKQCTTGAKVV